MNTCSMCKEQGVTCQDRKFGFSLGLFGITLIETDPVTQGRVATIAKGESSQEIHFTNEPIAQCAVLNGERSSEEVSKEFVKALDVWDARVALSNPGNY